MLELVEYRSDVVELTDDEAEELTGMTRGAGDDGRPRVIERLSKAGLRWRIQPGPFVGRFRLRSGRVVTIAGRFPFQDLAVLLELGQRTVLLYEAAVAAGGGPGLMDLIALAYAREAELIAGKGLLKAYERREFTRPPYPGVPSAAAHFRAHAGRPDRLATSASRLTPDVPVNRVVATALRRLCELPYADPALTARLRGLVPVFRAVTGLTGPPPVMTEVPIRYREVYDLARLVLGRRTALPTSDGVPGASVLFKMTDIWEAYAARWLARRFPGHQIRAQYRIELTDTGPSRPAVRADLVVELAGRPVAVFDAKYRKRTRYPSSDEVYQLYTYARRLHVDRAGLLYPGVELLRDEVTLDEVTIETYAVPVEPG